MAEQNRNLGMQDFGAQQKIGPVAKSGHPDSRGRQYPTGFIGCFRIKNRVVFVEKIISKYSNHTGFIGCFRIKNNSAQEENCDVRFLAHEENWRARFWGLEISEVLILDA